MSSSTRTGFIVIGAESTGTRAVTQLLIDAGCHGDSSHEQPLDVAIPPGLPMVVWRRSIPHGLFWPSVGDLVLRVIGAGYRPSIVVTMRDWSCAAKSQVAEGHVASMDEALSNLRAAYRHIFSGLELVRSLPYTIASYEALAAHPKAPDDFLSTLGLEAPKRAEFYDGNKKWRR